MNERWRTPAGGLRWRTWDDEAVVYNEASGSTHVLDSLAAEALRCLEEDAVRTSEELAERVAARLGIPHDAELQGTITRLIGEFERLDLIEPARP